MIRDCRITDGWTEADGAIIHSVKYELLTVGQQNIVMLYAYDGAMDTFKCKSSKFIQIDN